MGFNASVIVYNDALEGIRKDKEFGRKLAEAISKLSLPSEYRGPGGGDWGVAVSAGGYGQAATAIETHHADYDTIIAMGDNRGLILSNAVHPWSNKDDEDERVQYLRALADQMGYHIRKKPKRK